MQCVSVADLRHVKYNIPAADSMYSSQLNCLYWCCVWHDSDSGCRYQAMNGRWHWLMRQTSSRMSYLISTVHGDW